MTDELPPLFTPEQDAAFEQELQRLKHEAKETFAAQKERFRAEREARKNSAPTTPSEESNS